MIAPHPQSEIAALLSVLPIGISITDAAGRIIHSNPEAARLLGVSTTEHNQRRIDGPEWTIIRPDGAPMPPSEYASVRALQEQRRVAGVEMGIVKEDGAVTWLSVTAAPLPPPAGGVAVAYYDITERRQAEARLQESLALSQLLFEASPDPTALATADGTLLVVNRAAAAFSGYARADLIGRDGVQLGLVDLERWQRLVADGASGLPPDADWRANELDLTRPNGEQRRVEVRGYPVQVDGQLHYLCTLRDITERRQAEMLLRQREAAVRRANLELEQASHAKDDFLASMSHELRTPLHVILTYAEICQEQTFGPLTEKQGKAVDAIATAGHHLLDLINDILDVAKIDAGKLELALDVVAVDGACQAALLLVKEPAARQGVTVSYEPAARGLALVADARRLKQILVNLLSNAVKFTPAGGAVRLGVAPAADGATLLFTVTDTGIGIAPEDLERIFAPFEQADNAYTRQQEGTGLGLALVRRLAEQHGGTVRVASTVGVGSQFTVALPWRPAMPSLTPALTPAPPALVPSPATPPAASGVILLVDDSESVLYAVGEYLEHLGYTVVVARNGCEALAQAAACTPDLVLMDIQMPELNGLDATRQLHADPRLAHVPVVGLSALALPHDRELSLAAGMVEYISKPVALQALAETVARLLGGG